MSEDLFYDGWLDEFDLDSEWDNEWMNICDYAEELGMSPRYIEDEFYILGQLVKVPTNPPNIRRKDM